MKLSESPGGWVIIFYSFNWNWIYTLDKYFSTKQPHILQYKRPSNWEIIERKSIKKYVFFLFMFGHFFIFVLLSFYVCISLHLHILEMAGRSQLETLAFCGGNLVLAFLLFALVCMTRKQIPQVEQALSLSLFPNPASFENLPSDFWDDKIILRC